MGLSLETWGFCYSDAVKLERNVDAFNADASHLGGYAYTSTDKWSTRYATRKQAEAVIAMLARNFTTPSKFVDIGCGDGTFTIEIAQRLKAVSVRGVEPAPAAIEAARRKIPPGLPVSFSVDNIYDVLSQGEDVAFPAVLLLEPNGYNPGLKLIEKLSSYHRQHDEKSFAPSTLTRWFKMTGMKLVEQRLFCLVPYFFPTPAAMLLKSAEPIFEALPGIRHICCGTNLALYQRGH